MWRFVVRRLLWLVAVLLIITAITYGIFFVMSPVDPAVLFAGKQPTPQVIAEIKREFGLNKPAWQQYGLFVKHVFLGDRYGWPGLGFSFVTRASVKSQLGPRLVVTATLAFGAASCRPSSSGRSWTGWRWGSHCSSSRPRCSGSG